MSELLSKTLQLPKKRGRPKGPIGPTGPRKGSVAHWLSTFEMGETRWREADTSKRFWKQQPPTALASNADLGGMIFESLRYCAVPQSSKATDPIWIWRVTRTA